jgi:hypothetical protein
VSFLRQPKVNDNHFSVLSKIVSTTENNSWILMSDIEGKYLGQLERRGSGQSPYLLIVSITIPLPCTLPTYSGYDSLTTKQRDIHLMHLTASVANVNWRLRKEYIVGHLQRLIGKSGGE